MSLTFSAVLFDVDGTIVNSAPVIMGAFRSTLSDFGLEIPDDQRLRTYVGPPLWYSFGDLGYSGQLRADLVSRYRERPVIVGDSIWDVRGGHEAGIPVIGVGWGYATEDGLDDAEVVCETVEDLRALLMPAGY